MTAPHEQEPHKDAKYLDWRASERLADLDQSVVSAIPPQHASSLDELFAWDGEAFVTLAFRTFLHRAPSESELSDHLAQLRAGTAKHDLAASLRYSPEAQIDNRHFDLKRQRLRSSLENIPVLGRILSWSLALLGVGRAKRTLHAHQHEISSLRSEINRLHALLDVRSRGLCRDTVESHEVLAYDMNEKASALWDETRSLWAMAGELQSAINELQPGAGSGGDAALDKDFYIAFENHFRGAEDEIRQRMAFYLPLLDELLSTELKTATMVDIGCGRGEWLSLLREAGYDGIGIDLNDRNVSICRDKGFEVVKGDGIAWLRERENQSLGLISVFHVIEHLPLAQLNALLVEALRSLKPGGVLILETPNPENLVTAAHRFYTDPTHKNPIPPDLTEFLLRHKGFGEVYIHRLHPVQNAIAEDSETAQRLNALLYGPQDYAAIAVKPR